MRRSVGMVVLAVLVLGLAVPAVAEEYVYLDEDFESGLDLNSRAWGIYSLDDGHRGAGVRVPIKAGAHWGGNAHFYFNSKGFDQPDQLWWRYWIRFPEGFTLGPNDAGKLPGPAGLYTYNCLGLSVSTPEEPCWSARMHMGRSVPPYGSPDYPKGPDGVTQVGFYAYHLDGPPDQGETMRWDRAQASIANGTWACVEGYISMNTPGVHDGVLQGWVNGSLAFTRSDLAFRRAGEEYMHIQDFWFLAYYGGSATSPVNNEVHFDSLALSSQRIGCDDSVRHPESLRDVRDSAFKTNIQWLVDRGISKGCNPPDNNRYCPDGLVTRGEMAAFLSRALVLPTTATPFADVAGSVFEHEIGALTLAGITQGCTPTTFCPNDHVTREQMAAFLTRALKLYRPNTDSFTDDGTSVFESEIEALYYAGITTGCGVGLFCPRNPVTRGEMAAFLSRALG